MEEEEEEEVDGQTIIILKRRKKDFYRDKEGLQNNCGGTISQLVEQKSDVQNPSAVTSFGELCPPQPHTYPTSVSPICVMLHILLQSSVTPSSCRPTPHLTHPLSSLPRRIHVIPCPPPTNHKKKNPTTRAHPPLASLKTCRTHQSMRWLEVLHGGEERRGGWGEEGRSGCRERDRRSAALGMQSVGQSSTASCPSHTTTCQTKAPSKTRRPSTYFVHPSQ